MSTVPSQLLQKVETKQGAVRAVRFNVDGNYCLTCGSDKTIKLWNPYLGILLKTYAGSGHEVLDAAATSDNSQIAAGGVDKCLSLFDVETGKPLKRFRAHAAKINAVALNEESSLVFSASLDGTVRAWDLRATKSEKPVQIFDEAGDAVLSVHVGSHEVVTGSADRNSRTYDLREGRMTVDFLGESVTCVHLTPDEQCILATTQNGHVRLLDKSDGSMLADYKSHTNSEYKCESVVLSGSEHVAVGSEQGDVVIYDMVEQKVLQQLAHSAKVVGTLDSHPKRQCLITGAGSAFYCWISTDEAAKMAEEE